MAKFGVHVVNHDYRRLAWRRRPIAPSSIDVEGDASAASYFAALATLHGASITLSNLGIGHAPGRLRASSGCAKSSARASSERAAQHGHRRSAQARGGFRRRRRHDQHARRRTHADDARAVPDAADAHHRTRHAAREGMRSHRRAHARVAQARRRRVEEGPDYMVIEPLVADPSESRPSKSWKSRPITTIASPCPSACSDRACRACGFSIRAASRRPIRTTGRTGSGPQPRRGNKVLLSSAHAFARHRPRSSPSVFPLVGAAAFVLGRRSARGRRLRRDVDYFAGLDHLVNDRFDRATEVFTRLATKSHEADIQFALGSLMRKRGEVDRAIAIHTELAAPWRIADSRAGHVRAGTRLPLRGPHGSRRGEVAQPSGVGALPSGRARKTRVGLRAAARLARGARCMARAATREANASSPWWPRTTAVSSAKLRSWRAISPRRARRLQRPACTHRQRARVHSRGAHRGRLRR